MSHSFPTRRSSELKAAVVVFVNSDFSNAFLTITQGIVKTAFPAIANAATGTDETVKTSEARKVYDQLVTGTLERALMTEDANYYFTEEEQRDYKTNKIGSTNVSNPSTNAHLVCRLRQKKTKKDKTQLTHETR